MSEKLLLLVEDEFIIRDFVQAALEDAGFAVVTAGQATDALRLVQSATQPISALITDVQLGQDPDGWTLAHAARDIRPGLPVIYLSGQDMQAWTKKGVPGSIFLQKPLTISKMTQAIETAVLADEADRYAQAQAIHTAAE